MLQVLHVFWEEIKLERSYFYFCNRNLYCKNIEISEFSIRHSNFVVPKTREDLQIEFNTLWMEHKNNP